MDTGHDDHVRVHRLGFARQRQAVAGDVGDAVEDFRRHIIVRQDDRIALSLQAQDSLDVVLEGRPLQGRDHAADAAVECRSFRMKRRGSLHRRRGGEGGMGKAG